MLLNNITGLSYRFQWQPALGIVDTLAPAQLLQGPGAIGLFQVRVHTLEGCRGMRRFKVRDGRLSLKLSGPAGPVCQDWVAGYTASGTNLVDSSLVWQSSNLRQRGGKNLSWRLNGPPGVHTLYLTARNDSACVPIIRDSIQITTLDTPVLLDTVVGFCPGDTIRLAAPEDTSIYIRWPDGSASASYTQVVTAPVNLSIPISNRAGCSATRNYSFQLENFRPQLEVVSRFDACVNRYNIRFRNATPGHTRQRWQLNRNTLIVGDSGAFDTPPMPGALLSLTTNRRGCEATVTRALAFEGRPIYFDTAWQLRPLYYNCNNVPGAYSNTIALGADSVWYEYAEGREYGRVGRLVFADTGTHLVRLVQKIGGCKRISQRIVHTRALFLPNVVTANNDGRNDQLITLPESCKLAISGE